MPKELEGIIDESKLCTMARCCEMNREKLDIKKAKESLAQAIQKYIDAGYIKKSEVRVDESKVKDLLKVVYDLRNLTGIDRGIIANTISNHIQELITKEKK